MKSDTIVATTIDELLEQIKEYNPTCNEKKIREVYDLAADLHKEQKRDSGEPYIMHPLAVASILASLHMDDTTIMAGLLHDVVEDTDMTLEDIRKLYGDDMVVLLDGVTKLSKLEFRSKRERQVENLRKMFLAMSKDIRIIIIKLADRLHNMRTLSTHHSELRKKEIALETQEIFAPLAHRLGIYKIKWELEDLCLRYLEPEAYANLVEQITMKRDEREQFLNEVCETIKKNLDEAHISCEISGRPKNFYSIYRKMQRQNKPLNEIYDIHAVRVLVDTVKDCYGALGVVHTLWKPMPGRFKDYIAMPKANMYQSLHTTVIGPAGRPVEVQIRTYEMHNVAEYGIAAHWKYKEGKVGLDNSSASREVDKRLNWMRQMLDWQKEVSDASEFVENVKGDLFGEQSVFVFTPAGDVIELPYGSTPIDFAYRVHTQVGHQCVGAKVDGRIVQLDTTLQNGNIVEILTTRGTGPSRDWLKIVKTNQAKNKIRQWFRKEGRDEFAVQKGRSMLEKEALKNNMDIATMFKTEQLNEIIKRTNFVSVEDMYVALAEGAITTIGIINKIKEDNALKKLLMPEPESPTQSVGQAMKVRPFSGSNATHDKGVWVKGEADLMVRIANCCQPLPGDIILGYITRGRGVSIHKADCPNVRYYQEHEPERLVDVQWDNENTGVFQAEIEVVAMDRDALGVNIMAAISETKTRINSISFEVDADKICRGTVKMEINNLNQLEYIINKVKKIRGVTEVRRVQGNNKK
jgi:GTP pyrophosphokinase